MGVVDKPFHHRSLGHNSGQGKDRWQYDYYYLEIKSFIKRKWFDLEMESHMGQRISVDGTVACMEYGPLALHYTGGIMEASLEGALAAAPDGLQFGPIRHEELGSTVSGFKISPPIKCSVKRFPENIGVVITVGFNRREGRSILNQLSRAAQLSIRIRPADASRILGEEYGAYLQHEYELARSVAADFGTDEGCAFGIAAYQQFLERSTSLPEEERVRRVLSAYIIPKAGVSPLLH